MPKLGHHHRRSIRLRGYDYASYGAYFVTLCVQGRLPLLGEVAGDEMRLNPAGEMVREVWENVTHMYPGVAGDVYVIMPNHVHAIVLLTGAEDDGVVGATLRGCPGEVVDAYLGQGRCTGITGDDAHLGRGRSPAPTGGDDSDGGTPSVVRPITVGDVVGRFKTYTTRLYGEGVALQGWPPYQGRLWQRDYYEHIIRNERELVAIRAYIQNNPLQWAMDRENPDRL